MAPIPASPPIATAPNLLSPLLTFYQFIDLAFWYSPASPFSALDITDVNLSLSSNLALNTCSKFSPPNKKEEYKSSS